MPNPTATRNIIAEETALWQPGAIRLFHNFEITNSGTPFGANSPFNGFGEGTPASGVRSGGGTSLQPRGTGTTAHDRATIAAAVDSPWNTQLATGRSVRLSAMVSTHTTLAQNTFAFGLRGGSAGLNGVNGTTGGQAGLALSADQAFVVAGAQVIAGGSANTGFTGPRTEVGNANRFELVVVVNGVAEVVPLPTNLPVIAVNQNWFLSLTILPTRQVEAAVTLAGSPGAAFTRATARVRSRSALRESSAFSNLPYIPFASVHTVDNANGNDIWVLRQAELLAN